MKCRERDIFVNLIEEKTKKKKDTEKKAAQIQKKKTYKYLNFLKNIQMHILNFKIK